MNSEMASKERILTVLRMEEPDRVPVFPGLDYLISARCGRYPLNVEYGRVKYKERHWRNMLEFAKRFKYDAWFYMGSLGGSPKDCPEGMRVTDVGDVQKIERWVDTPKGRLESISIQMVPGNTVGIGGGVEGLVKDINEDVDKVEYLLVDPWTMDATPLRKMYDVCENYGIVGATVGLPWDWWASLRGSIPLTVKDFFVHFDVLGPLFEKYTNWAVEYVKASIETGALDEIMLGGSTSSLSVISPRVFRSCNYEFINKVTDLCYEYNVPSHLHVCGRSRAVLDIIADTRLTVMEPLERPPGGDVDLREVKEKFGDKLVLKGNVNTFHTMAFGTPNDVKRECIECIKTAAYGGGFWLSTGDQIPAETPFKNITAMVEAAKEYGSYPLRP